MQVYISLECENWLRTSRALPDTTLLAATNLFKSGLLPKIAALLIGASVSEPHTSELNGRIFRIYHTYVHCTRTRAAYLLGTRARVKVALRHITSIATSDIACVARLRTYCTYGTHT